jgi:transcriptional repressor of cell division inhibition gene dicB
MRKTDVLAFFGGTIKTAAALGITGGAVSQWGDLVPELAAYKTQVISRNRLRVNPADYPSKHTGAQALPTLRRRRARRMLAFTEAQPPAG